MSISLNNVEYEHIALGARLENLVGNTFRSDFTFIIEDDNAEIPAHKLIIALSSPVLDRIVYGNDTFAPTNVLKVDGISKESFMEILRYIYTDKVNVNEENVFEILNKSNYFGLPGIERKCFQFLNKHLSVSTVPWIYHQLFHAFSTSNILAKCLHYIRIQPMQFFTSQYFENISIDELKSILEMDTINCTEVDLFAAMIKLSTAHCIADGLEVNRDNQRKVLAGSELLLRLGSITENEFNDCLAIQNDFFSSDEIERIRTDIKNTNSKAVKRKWHTFHDAVWKEVVDLTELPPSCFYSGSKHFIYRRSKDDQEPEVSDDFSEDLLGGYATIEILCGSGYEWHTCENGVIPFNAVSISHKNSEPVFIVLGIPLNRHLHIGSSFMNGNTLFRQDLRYISFDSDEEDDDLSIPRLSTILVARNVKHPYTGDGVPDDAIFVGFDENNYKTYLGKAWHDGDLLPAKVILQLGTFVPYETQEIRVDQFEFVRMDSGTYKWEEGKNGEVPVNAVIGGCTEHGETLYFGRVFHDGIFIPGKIHPSHEVLYVPYRGHEISFRCYEVLIQIMGYDDA